MDGALLTPDDWEKFFLFLLWAAGSLYSLWDRRKVARTVKTENAEGGKAVEKKLADAVAERNAHFSDVKLMINGRMAAKKLQLSEQARTIVTLMTELALQARQILELSTDPVAHEIAQQKLFMHDPADLAKAIQRLKEYESDYTEHMAKQSVVEGHTLLYEYLENHSEQLPPGVIERIRKSLEGRSI